MTNRSDIAVYLQCVWCKRDGVGTRIEVGFNTEGNLQLWCLIHDCAIGPAFELRYPPLVAHLTCRECHDTERRTHEHSSGKQEHPGENVRDEISGHEHNHEHGHEKER